MSDPAPEGYVSVRIAFQRYCSCHKPVDDVLLHLGPFIALLKSGSLRTIVRDPDRGERFSVPPEAWDGAWYVERPVLADRILGGEGDRFRPYAGRTPFVAEAHLAEHLKNSAHQNSSCRDQRPERYPWRACRAAFDERVALEGAPTVNGGQKGWRIQADVEKWVEGWMIDNQDPTSEQPGRSTIRAHVTRWLAELRGQPK